MCLHASWVPILAVFLILLVVPILAAHPCPTHSSLYWLWGPTLAVDACTSSITLKVVHSCTSCVPVPAVSPWETFSSSGREGPPKQAPGFVLAWPGLTATHKLLGRERR